MSDAYRPVHTSRRRARHPVRTALIMIILALSAIVVTVVRTMPHPPPSEQLTLDQLEMMLPDTTQTEVMAAIVRARLGQTNGTTPSAAPAGRAPGCAPSTPHQWNTTQRGNATTIVQVGVALGVPVRGEIVAVATAMQESRLYNLGDLGANNNSDSLGLFQQRPSMGWGTAAQVTDPVYAATAFYLRLQYVPGWESMSVTDAAQRVQRSGAPDAYAQWQADATALVEDVLCVILGAPG
jgi:hypothetical protein